MNQDNEGWFEVKPIVMQDQAALDRWWAKNKDPEPGTVPIVDFIPLSKRKKT